MITRAETTTRNTNLVLKIENPETKNENKKKERIKKKVTWSEDTVDNENMNKLKSNICCIYTPPPDKRIDTCSSDDNNELERSEETKREHLKSCKKKHKCG
jgi:protein phosphatase 1 regulatory subunit 11